MKLLLNKKACILLLGLIFIFGCGGGTDIGNPDIRGVVCYNNGKRVSGAMVVKGSKKWDMETTDTVYGKDLGDFLLKFSSRAFDTAYCNRNGEFHFDSIVAGEYMLFASKDTFLGIQQINHNYYEDTYCEINVNEPVKVSIIPYYIASDSNNWFSAARVSGTPVYAKADSTGWIKLDAVPSGNLDLILYKNDGQIEKYSGLGTFPGCSSTLKVDPLKTDEYWTPMPCGVRDPQGRPFIIWSSPDRGVNNVDQVFLDSEKEYDIEIQFSHPMDTRNTISAVSVYSTDSSAIAVDSIWWQGADMMRLSLCSSDSTGNCSQDFLYDTEVTYTIIIDTNAQTVLGVNLAYPDTLSFIIEP